MKHTKHPEPSFERLTRGGREEKSGREVENNRGSCGRMNELDFHHSSPCFLHLSAWHVQTAAITQLAFNASTRNASHSLIRPLAFDMVPSPASRRSFHVSVFPFVCILQSLLQCLFFVLPFSPSPILA